MATLNDTRRPTAPATPAAWGAPEATTWGAICTRCSHPYLATSFPHNCLCPDCYLGTLTPEMRSRLLGRIASTGRGIRRG